MQLTLFPERATTDEQAGTVYTPFIADGIAGLKCEVTLDGATTVRYWYLNPSGDDDAGLPNMFLYADERLHEGELVFDMPAHYYATFGDDLSEKLQQKWEDAR